MVYVVFDWSKVLQKNLYVFYFGVVLIEWVVGKGDYSGVSGLKKGEICVGCYVEDGKLSFDLKCLVSKEMELKGVFKMMIYLVVVQVVYDVINLYVCLSFKVFVGGFDKLDKENEVKVIIMFFNDKVLMGDQVGCWVVCYKDVCIMLGVDDKKIKYVMLGVMDLMQWKSSGKFVDGLVIDKCNMDGGKVGVMVEGVKVGDVWIVIFICKLVGGVNFVLGKVVLFGVVIYVDNVGGCFYYVFFGYIIGFGVDGDVKVVK